MQGSREEIVRELAETAADKVAGIVEEAERRAAEIEAGAQREAERIVEAARDEAKEQVDRAQGAVSRLVEQADELRAAVGKLGSELAPGGGRAETTPPEPEITPQPPRVPEPEPPREPEPTPPLTPEPQPPPTPEPQPPDVPEPQPPGPEVEGRRSTEELIEQLKGGASAGSAGPKPAPAVEGGNGAEGTGGADAAAARLVAMKMALDGSSRDEVDRHLAESYGPADRSDLLDEVFSRVGK